MRDTAEKDEAGIERSGDREGSPPLLGRKSVLLGMLTSGFVVANAAQPSALAASKIKPIAAATPAYVSKWAPATAYVRGQQVVSPNNDVVSANVSHTSSSAYATDTAKWNLSSTFDRVGATVVSALDYGAVGDGVTDNYLALTAALTAIKACTANAKAMTLHLPGTGTYLTSAPVLLNAPGLTLRGDGRGTTKLKLSGALTGDQAPVKVTGAGCRVRDITIDAGGRSTYGLWCVPGDDLVVSDVTVTGSVSHGIVLQGGGSITMRNVSMVNCGTAAGQNPTGLFASSCANLVLDHCHAIGSYQHGYYLLGGATTSLTMTGCTATGNGGHGISARSSSATITGCYSWGNLWNSLIISHPIEPSTKGARATITGNVFGGSTAPPADEVQITGLDNVVFTGNLVEGSAISGAVLHFIATTRLTATGNSITSTTSAAQSGIQIDTSTDYLCASNNIKGALSGAGVYIVASSSGKIADNKVDSFTNGIYLAASASSNVHVTHNMLTKVSGWKAASVSTGTGVVLVGNNPVTEGNS